jgi:hypothetical protein
MRQHPEAWSLLELGERTMTSLINESGSELLRWIENECEQIAAELENGSMSVEDACRFLGCVRSKIRQSIPEVIEPEANEYKAVERIEAEKASSPPAPKKSRRCWLMVVVDLESGTQRIRERKLTKLEASLAVRLWPAKSLNAVAIMWPDWAPMVDFAEQIRSQSALVA